MNEPITWHDLMLINMFYMLGAFLALGFFTLFVGLATRLETWKKKQPDWQNDWD